MGNDFDNVYLFTPEMLPRGCVHLKLPGLTPTMCKKLGIDACRAVTSWSHKQHGSYPNLEGVVVCAEFEDVVRDAWRQYMERKRKREKLKRTKRAIGNWRKLVNKLLIRQRLQREYGGA